MLISAEYIACHAISPFGELLVAHSSE